MWRSCIIRALKVSQNWWIFSSGCSQFLLKYFLTCNLNPTLKSNIEKMNYLSDNTDYTSIRTEDFTRDVHGLIFDMSKEVVLPSWYWEIDLGAQNAIGFYQRDAWFYMFFNAAYSISSSLCKIQILCNHFHHNYHWNT